MIGTSERSTVAQGVLRRFWTAGLALHQFHVHLSATRSLKRGKEDTDLHIARALNLDPPPSCKRFELT